MDDLRVIADDVQDGVPGYETGEFFVMKDGPIKKVEDLKGKVLASVGPGTAVDIAIRAMLKKSGLIDKRDYQIVTAGFPAMNAMLMDGKASLVPSIKPWMLDAKFQTAARPLFTDRQALDGPSQFIVYVAHESWLKAHRAAVVDCLEDLIRAAGWWRDPKNHEQATGILAGMIHAPKKALEYKFTKDDLYQDPNLIPNTTALQHTIDLQHSLGLLPHKLDMSKYVDLSYVKEAGARVNGM